MLKELAKKLRKSGNWSEVLLWEQLKNKKLGFRFHRQKPIGNYIVDFFCRDLNLIIEIDGDTHLEKGEQDQMRQKRLESLGYFLLRFDDRDVKNQLGDVVESIRNWINTPRALRAHPSQEGNFQPLL